MNIKFCTQCGNTVKVLSLNNDTHQRHVCEQCGFIHYQNPKIITGCLVYQDSKVLLCRRAIEPRQGLWTVPAGFMENGESTRAAAQRETWEEAGAYVNTKELFVIANLPHANQVYMLYLAELQNATFQPGQESSEVKLLEKSQVPWDDIAFYTVKLSLQYYFEDVDKGKFLLHEIDF